MKTVRGEVRREFTRMQENQRRAGGAQDGTVFSRFLSTRLPSSRVPAAASMASLLFCLLFSHPVSVTATQMLGPLESNCS